MVAPARATRPMSLRSKTPIARSIPTRLLALLLAATSIAAVALLFPVYFRTDDTRHLEWAATHPDPLAAFEPGEAGLSATFRPLPLLVWWSIFRCFGLNPLPYHLALLFTLALALIVYFECLARILSARAAAFGVVALAVCFSYLAQVGFWFSNLALALELLCIHLALYWILTKSSRGSAALGVLAALGAMLSKEPAVLLLPAVAMTHLWSRWPAWSTATRRRGTWTCATLTVLALLWTVVHPHFWNRTQVFGHSADRLGFLWERWSFYASQLLSGPGILLALLIVYQSWRCWFESGTGRGKRSLVALLACSGAAIVLARFPELALLVLMLACAAIFWSRRSESFSAVWFALPVIALLTVELYVRSYLAEAAFGAAALAGVALDRVATLVPLRSSQLRRPVVRLITIAALIAMAVAAVPRIKQRLETLRVVSAARQNLEAVVDYIDTHLRSPGTQLFVIDYEDMGLSHVEDILPLPDRLKAQRQKTMTSDDLGRLLRLVRPNVEVHNLGAIRIEGNGAPTYLLVMSRFEHDFVEGLALPLRLQFSEQHSGESVWLYAISSADET